MTLRYAHGIRHDQHATFVACARAGVRAGVLCACVCVCVRVLCVYRCVYKLACQGRSELSRVPPNSEVSGVASLFTALFCFWGLEPQVVTSNT